MVLQESFLVLGQIHLLLVSVTANGVAGIIPRAIVHVFEGEWAIFLFLLVCVTTNKMRQQMKTSIAVARIIPRAFVPVFGGK
jgi:hypothetical protein